MGIIGGFIHKFGLIGASSTPKTLGFVPDSMYISQSARQPRVKTGQWYRGSLSGAVGGNSGQRLAGDTTYMSMMPEDGAFKWFEIYAPTNQVLDTLEFYIQNVDTDEEMCNLTILNGQTGVFTNEGVYTFSKSDKVKVKADRSPNTSGGVDASTMLIGITYDD